MQRAPVGELVRHWRVHRRRSQLDLALAVGTSTRHLSFIETGRSRPSPELLLALADGLDVPLRERNALLLAAGYAPRYSQAPLDDPSMVPMRATVQRLLDAHDPYPGVVVDRAWNVVLSNEAAGALTAGLPDQLLGPPLNVYRVCLHPDGLAARTLNFAEWATSLLAQLRRSIVLTADSSLEELYAEVTAYPNVAQLLEGKPSWEEPELLVPLVLAAGVHRLSFFTMLTTFGTPRDVTLDEIAVELFYPADDATELILRT